MIHKVLKLSITNCYILKAGNCYILVDTGYDWEWETFSAELRKTGISYMDIQWLLLTHHHDDHAGLLNNLLQENPNIKVVMSIHAERLVRAGKNARTGGYINKMVYMLAGLKQRFDKKWTQSFPPYITRDVDILIREELPLRKTGIELDGKIIETPGHTRDSISVVLDDGDCIVGDAASNFLRFAGTRHCAVYLEDLEQFYGSWNTIIEAGAKRIYPSHGPPFSVEELKKNISRNRKRNMVPDSAFISGEREPTGFNK